MKKFQNLNFTKQVLLVYLLSLLFSLIFSPLFGKFYIWAFNPKMIGSFLPAPNDQLALSGGTLFGFFLFLSFFSSFLLREKRKLAWLIGFIIPFSMALVNGQKFILWALLFSLVGFLLAKTILFLKCKLQK